MRPKRWVSDWVACFEHCWLVNSPLINLKFSFQENFSPINKTNYNLCSRPKKLKLSKTLGMTINNSFLLQEKTKLFLYQENLDFIGNLIVSLATTGSIESNAELFGSFSLALKLNNKIHADKLPHNTFHSPYKTYINISCWNPCNGLIVLFGDIFHWLDK